MLVTRTIVLHGPGAFERRCRTSLYDRYRLTPGQASLYRCSVRRDDGGKHCSRNGRDVAVHDTLDCIQRCRLSISRTCYRRMVCANLLTLRGFVPACERSLAPERSSHFCLRRRSYAAHLCKWQHGFSLGAYQAHDPRLVPGSTLD